MRAIFLSDVHLRSRKDERYCILLSFLNEIKGKCEHLVLVGDFFDFWFSSSKRIYPEYVPVIDRLIDLKQSGTTIHLCEGNHDFYMNAYFGGTLGMKVFEDAAELALDGKRLFVAHGDLVDRQNTRYLFLRRILRSRPFYHFQRLIPAALRWWLASLSSDVSKGFNEEASDKMVQKMERFATDQFRAGYDAVILGHCHKPVLKKVVVNQSEKVFVSLGDWVAHFSYLNYEDGTPSLKFYSPLAVERFAQPLGIT